jgi:uncharacterized protein YkvS
MNNKGYDTLIAPAQEGKIINFDIDYKDLNKKHNITVSYKDALFNLTIMENGLLISDKTILNELQYKLMLAVAFNNISNIKYL